MSCTHGGHRNSQKQEQQQLQERQQRRQQKHHHHRRHKITTTEDTSAHQHWCESPKKTFPVPVPPRPSGRRPPPIIPGAPIIPAIPSRLVRERVRPRRGVQMIGVPSRRYFQDRWGEGDKLQPFLRVYRVDGSWRPILDSVALAKDRVRSRRQANEVECFESWRDLVLRATTNERQLAYGFYCLRCFVWMA